MMQISHITDSSEKFQDTLNFYLKHIHESGNKVIDIKYSAVPGPYGGSYSAIIIYKKHD